MNDVLGSNQRWLVAHAGAGEDAGLAMALALLRVGRRVDAVRSVLLRPVGLSDGRLGVLLALAQEPSMSPARLAEWLEVSRATVTGLVDGLVRRGLVERRAQPGDRRAQQLFLTAAGEQAMQESSVVVEEFLGRLVRDCPESDVAATVRTLQAMWRALDGMAAEMGRGE